MFKQIIILLFAVSNILIAANKILIIAPSMGMGHMNSAEIIKKNILTQDSGAQVTVRDIKDFFGHTWKKLIDRRLYEEKLLYKYIDKEKPDVIIALHYIAAQALNDLRDKGFLGDTRIAWVQTDYSSGFLPNISKSLDHTFLLHPALRDWWKREGVPGSRISASAVPIDPSLFKKENAREFLLSVGLDPTVKTITFVNNQNSRKDFEATIKNIISSYKKPLQLIIADSNIKNIRNIVEKYKNNIPEYTKIKLIDDSKNHDEVIKYIKSSDLFITKAKGLSPVEGFAIKVPMILIEDSREQDKKDVKIFEELGLAYVNRDPNTLAYDIEKVLTVGRIRRKMLRQQIAFRAAMDVDRIVDFTLKTSGDKNIFVDLGLENGSVIKGGLKALRLLERDVPADVEIILAYAIAYENTFLSHFKLNPAGHIALRVGDVVYSTDGNAKVGVKGELLHGSSLFEYLYGVKRLWEEQQMSSTVGLSYRRENVSLRIQGVSDLKLKAMHAEAAKIQAEWYKGDISYDLINSNCADFVKRILLAGGFDVTRKSPIINPLRFIAEKYAFPLDIFNQYLNYFDNQKDYQTDLVFYSKVPASKQELKETRFPVSIRTITRSVWNVIMYGLGFNYTDPIVKKATKKLQVYPFDNQVYYEHSRNKTRCKEYFISFN